MSPRGIAAIKREAAQESKSYEFAVRQYYKLLPTDPHFLMMTRKQVLQEFWRIYYFKLREKNPGQGVEEAEFDGSEAFTDAMRDVGMVQDDVTGEWVEVDPDEIEGIGD